MDSLSKSRIDGFAFERQDAEGALVDAAERFAPDEAFETFHAKSELTQGERVFRTQRTI